MYLPDYEKSSLVNFMGNILISMGAKPVYEPLENFDNSALSDAENIVLIVIDGLGYEYLQTYGKNTFLQKHISRKLTSIFPSTTASAITALQTGLSTLEHALTGWFVYLKELGTASIILPFKPRYGDYSFGKMNIKPEEIFDFKNIFDQINRQSFHIIPRFILNSEFSTFAGGRANRLGYKTLQGFVNQINKAIKSSDAPKLIYAYWAKFDSLSHEKGMKSKKVFNHFLEIDAAINALKKSQKKNDTNILVTADHGLLDTEKSKTLYMKDHPDLRETLILPLCGEPRVPCGPLPDPVGSAPGPDRRGPPARRSRAASRRAGRALLGRDETPAGDRPGLAAHAASPVPRRADPGPRPADPPPYLGLYPRSEEAA